MHDNQLERLSANAEWVPVAASLAKLCNAWAMRRDLIVYLGRDGGQGKASAFYDPERAQIEVNSRDAFGDTEASGIGDLTDRMELSKFPVAGGLSLHEAMHARYSTSDLAEVHGRMRPSAFTLLQELEELRVEGRGVIAYPRDAGYLRASTKTLLMEEGPESWSNRGTAVLLVGREHVGVLDREDVLPLESYLFGQDGWSVSVLNQMRDIITEFVMLDDSGSEFERQIELANTLDEILPKDPMDLDELLGQMIAAALSAAERGAYRDVYEAAEEATAEADREAREVAEAVSKQNEKTADQVFRTDKGSTAPVPLELRDARQPNSRERGAAVRLSRDLEKARYRDREVVDFDSQIPPGRLDGAEAMRLSAARWAGGDTSRYQPFKRRERFEVDEAKLTVGIMCDTSGSMMRVQPGIGIATYVISEAVYRIENATAAQVYFGEAVRPGLRKGERLREVRTWKGGGAYEEFDRGFRALDGELDLLNGTGARLLFVASDGEYKDTGRRNQVELSNQWIKACTDNGVAVIWLQLRGQNALAKFPGLEVITVGDDVLDVTEAIGQACIRSMATVSGL